MTQAHAPESENRALGERIKMLLCEAGYPCSLVDVEELEDGTIDVSVVQHLDQPEVPDDVLDKALALASRDDPRGAWERNSDTESLLLVRP